MRVPSCRILRLAVASSLLAALPAALSGQSEEDRVKATLTAMWAAIEAGDVEAYARHVHPEFTSFGETDPYLNEGKAADVASITDWVARVKGVRTRMHNPQVTVRGDVAWITYYWTDVGTTLEGERTTSAGKSTRIFVKEGGRWLCIHGHYTLRP